MPRRLPLVDPRFPGRLHALRVAAGLSVRELATAVYLSRTHVHDLGTGRRPPAPEHAARLDAALGAGGELAGLVSTDPARVGSAAELAGRLAAARELEDQVGAAPMLSTAAAHLDALDQLLRDAGWRARPGLVAVGGQWAQWAGWLHLAAGRRARAEQLLERALVWAAEAGDRELVATVLSFRGYAVLGDQPAAAVGLTEAALRDPHVFPGQRAYDRYQLARGYALLGERRPVVEELAAADDLAAEAAEHSGPRPPWHYYRSPAHFQLEAGLVQLQLGHRARAAELLTAGLAGLPDGMATAEWTGPARAALAAVCPSAT